MLGTMAGAQSTKFKANFRTNQNSQAQLATTNKFSQKKLSGVPTKKTLQTQPDHVDISDQAYDTAQSSVPFPKRALGAHSAAKDQRDQYMDDLLDLNAQFLDYNNRDYSKTSNYF